MQRDSWVTAAEASNKVVLVGLYGAFGGVGVMMMVWHKLEVDTFTVHEGFETGRALIVKHLEDGEPVASEMVVQGGIGL